MRLAGDTLESLQTEINDADDEVLLDIFKSNMEMEQKLWVLKAKMLYNRHESTAKKNKNKMIKEVAKAMGVARSRAYDLINIYKYILVDNLELASLPFLNQNHFVTIVRNLKKIEEKEEDLVTLLQKANDENWNSLQLKDYITDNEIRYLKEVWYKIDSILENEPAQQWQDEPKKLFTNITQYKNEAGEVYLKIKQYE